MTTLIFDTEATGAQRNKANPFDPRNVACSLGIKNKETGEVRTWKLQYDDSPYGEALQEIKALISECTILIGFNSKYDLHWFYRYGIKLPPTCFVYDCAAAFYVLTSQKYKYPSLDFCAEYFGLPKKLDIVKTEYWEKGLDTNEVPYEILDEYLLQDLDVTEAVYDSIEKQLADKPLMRKLVKLENLDMVVLSTIEQNGIKLDVEKCNKRSGELVEEINDIDNVLTDLAGYAWFNPSSGEHLSAFLYGGKVSIVEKVPFIFTYKDGRTSEKQRNEKVEYAFTGYFKPLAGSELAKEGFYATDKATLVTLAEKATKEQEYIINLLLRRSKLEKRRATYYDGFPKKIEEGGWENNLIHSNFNQCVTATGRLSSTKP